MSPAFPITKRMPTKPIPLEELLAVVRPSIEVNMDTNRQLAERLHMRVSPDFFWYTVSQVEYMVGMHRPVACVACGKKIHGDQPMARIHIQAGWLSHEEVLPMHAYREPCTTNIEAREFRKAVAG